jgi:hypothetical protein
MTREGVGLGEGRGEVAVMWTKGALGSLWKGAVLVAVAAKWDHKVGGSKTLSDKAERT